MYEMFTFCILLPKVSLPKTSEVETQGQITLWLITTQGDGSWSVGAVEWNASYDLIVSFPFSFIYTGSKYSDNKMYTASENKIKNQNNNLTYLYYRAFTQLSKSCPFFAEGRNKVGRF